MQVKNMEKVKQTPSVWLQIKSGMASYPKAIGLITRKRMLWMFAVPFLLSLVLFFGGISLVNQLTDLTVNSINSLIDYQMLEEEYSGFIETSLKVSLWIIFKVLFFFVYAYVGGYIVIIFMSPFLSYVSERTEYHAAGRKTKNSLYFFLYTAWRGVLIALRNLLLQSLVTVLLLVASFIPFVGLVVPFLLFFISAYFYGFSFMDYHLERKVKGIRTSIKYIQKRKFKAIGVGIPFALLLYIPVIGTFLAGFFSIIATVAASISLMDEEAKNPTYATS